MHRGLSLIECAEILRNPFMDVARNADIDYFDIAFLNLGVPDRRLGLFLRALGLNLHELLKD